jgi:hypothetical protein
MPPATRVRLTLTRDGRLFITGSKEAAQLAIASGFDAGYYFLSQSTAGTIQLSQKKPE